jgi:hypothetical protein
MNHYSLVAAELNIWSTNCKAVMQDAASRSSDPEPLTAEHKAIAISIMAIPPSSLCLARSRRIMGMRGSRQPASSQHLLPAGLLASHARQALHAVKKSADSRDLARFWRNESCRAYSGGRKASTEVHVCNMTQHSASARCVPSCMQKIDIVMLCFKTDAVCET